MEKDKDARHFLRSDSRNPYSKKLDPAVKDHRLAFVRKQTLVKLEL